MKRVTRSRWSHVSIYVGPLQDGSDPPCIVEADIAEGVRSIRLSELDALRIRVLRPRSLNDAERSRLADWVVSKIGSEYDLAYAWALGQDLLHLHWRTRSRSSSPMITNNATRFICCSLLAHAFALIGYPISRLPMRIGVAATEDYGSLTPGDFEHAAIFEVLPEECRRLTRLNRMRRASTQRSGGLLARGQSIALMRPPRTAVASFIRAVQGWP